MAILTHNDTHCGHVSCRPPSVTTKGVGDYLGEESSMRLSYSGLNVPGYDLNYRIHGCPVEKHSLVGQMTLDLKKKKRIRQ